MLDFLILLDFVILNVKMFYIKKIWILNVESILIHSFNDLANIVIFEKLEDVIKNLKESEKIFELLKNNISKISKLDVILITEKLLCGIIYEIVDRRELVLWKKKY